MFLFFIFHIFMFNFLKYFYILISADLRALLGTNLIYILHLCHYLLHLLNFLLLLHSLNILPSFPPIQFYTKLCTIKWHFTNALWRHFTNAARNYKLLKKEQQSNPNNARIANRVQSTNEYLTHIPVPKNFTLGAHYPHENSVTTLIVISQT